MRPAFALLALFTVACGGSSGGPGPGPTVPGQTGCPDTRPEFGEPATEADRSLFAYDANAPKDLRRAIDVLQARPDVDDNRIGFVGNSYGGMIGALLVGVDPRLKAAVLSTAGGGWVTFHTSTLQLNQFLNQVPCATRSTWFQAMVPIEPIRYISNSTTTSLLFQIAQLDDVVAQDDAMALYNAAGGAKEVRVYNAGHPLNLEALSERFEWLREQLGFDPDPPPPGGSVP